MVLLRDPSNFVYFLAFPNIQQVMACVFAGGERGGG